MVFQTLCGELLAAFSRVHAARLLLSNPRQLVFMGLCWSSGRPLQIQLLSTRDRHSLLCK